MLLTGPGGVRVRGEYGGGVDRPLDHAEGARSVADRARRRGRRRPARRSRRFATSSIADGRVAGVIAERPRRPGADASGADGDRRRWPAQRDRDRPRPVATAAAAAPMGDRRVFQRTSPACTTLGEMHVRRGHYIGVAPVPGGLTNACLVVPHDSRGRFGATGDRSRRRRALERYLERRSRIVRALRERARGRAADDAWADGGGYDGGGGAGIAAGGRRRRASSIR